MSKDTYTVYTDGGSRGNPGPAALGVVLQGDAIGKKEYGEYIGITTNNIAEYSAAIFALKKLKQLLGTEKAKSSVVNVFSDSELLVKQVNGEYKIKEDSMRDLFMELWNLRLDFNKVIFAHVMREQNKEADKMVNFALDQEQNKLL
jgi:ribonuclease HI